MTPENSARNYYLEKCLPLYRMRNYNAARQALETYFSRYESQLSIREKLMARLAMSTSLMACLEKGEASADVAEQFVYQLDCYFKELAKAELPTLAPEPFLDFFSLIIRFSLKIDTLERIGESVIAGYERITALTCPKMAQEEYLDIWIKEIHNERRNFLRTDRLERSLTLTKALIDITNEKTGLMEFCIEGERIMADILYFSYTGSMNDNLRFTTVIAHLDHILQKKPDDSFALQFKRHINDLSGSMLQIRRFQHDTGTTLGNLNIHMQKLRRECPEDSNLYPGIMKALEEVKYLRTVSSLVTDSQPAVTDWEEIDIGEMIASLLMERNFSNGCMTVTGVPEKWECCPNLVALVLRNLVKNSLEAYGRKGIVLPVHPVSFHIDYFGYLLYYRDYAGGIDTSIGDIFEPYRSSKGVYSNVGLGLPQARKAMEIQDFSLTLPPNQPDDGSLFLLDFS